MPSRGSSLLPAYGIRGDGVVGDASSLQSYINDADGAGVVPIPFGNYVIDSSISIPNYTALVGVMPGPFDSALTPAGVTAVSAPTFIIPNNSVSPVQFTGRSASISNIMFYYPNQIAPTSASVPTVYPPTITTQIGSAGVNIRGCTIVNGYAGIQLYGGRHNVIDCNLGCFSQPLVVDHSLDRITLQNIHCGPFWNPIVGLSGAQNIDSWVAQNQTVLTVMRADALRINGLFAFSAAAANGNVGMSMIDGTDSPSCSYGDAVNVRFDTFSTGVSCKATQAPGWQFANYSANCSTANVAMPVGGSLQPKMRVVSGSWWGSNKGFTNAAGGLLAISAGAVEGFDPRGSLAPPGVPASGSTVANGNAVPCMVTIACAAGVTVSIVAIGGSATGLVVNPSTQASVIVMPNQGINLTYSGGTPTWTWFGL